MSLEQHWPYKSSIYNIYMYRGRGKLLARDQAQNFRKAFHVRERERCRVTAEHADVLLELLAVF